MNFVTVFIATLVIASNIAFATVDDGTVRPVAPPNRERVNEIPPPAPPQEASLDIE